MLQWIKVQLYTAWDATKAWFKRSETVFLARMAVIGGVVTSTIGAFDWSPLWSFLGNGTDFTWKQVLMIGASIAGAGLTLEMARRRGTTTLKSGSLSVKK